MGHGVQGDSLGHCPLSSMICPLGTPRLLKGRVVHLVLRVLVRSGGATQVPRAWLAAVLSYVIKGHPSSGPRGSHRSGDVLRAGDCLGRGLGEASRRRSPV